MEMNWTSVDDGLPTKTDKYIVCIDSPDLHMSSEKSLMYRVFTAFFVVGSKKFNCFQDITHWMPKPLPPDYGDAHYLIIGAHFKKPIGCTWGQGGKEDVLSEDTLATFEEINKNDCPICKQNEE